MKFSADYRALALDALRGRWKTAVLAGLIASLLGANIVSSSDRVISNMSQNANGDTPGFAGLFSTGSGGVLAVLVICILAWAVFTVIVGGAAGLRPVQPEPCRRQGRCPLRPRFPEAPPVGRLLHEFPAGALCGALVAAAVHPRRGKSLQLCHDPLYHGRAPRPDGQRGHH